MKQELVTLSVKQIINRRNLREVNEKIDHIGISIPYEGITFTIALATATLGKRVVAGEGVSRKSLCQGEVYRRITGHNEAMSRALEALDKKLRRKNGYVGDKYEG